MHIGVPPEEKDHFQTLLKLKINSSVSTNIGRHRTQGWGVTFKMDTLRSTQSQKIWWTGKDSHWEEFKSPSFSLKFFFISSVIAQLLETPPGLKQNLLSIVVEIVGAHKLWNWSIWPGAPLHDNHIGELH